MPQVKLVYLGELRNGLESRGHGFRGHADREIILEAVSEWGLEAAVKKFVTRILVESGGPSGLGTRLAAHTVDKRRSPTVFPETEDVVVDEPHGPGYCRV